ncbi:Uncharacterised protein [Faecalicoccus pleomorphus]|uniref:Uncharacterized protein n=1 Tax=Faecalicoccus pleomorphus TaxID=1323 RepID=A0A380LNT3_9FIRM|nr:Uncharacterised protein [Faecalicoccus pleomorphus]
MNSEYVFHGFMLMLFVIWFAVIKKTKSSSKNVYLIEASALSVGRNHLSL